MLVQFQRYRDDWLSPVGCIFEVARIAYVSTHHMEHEFGFGYFAGRGVGIRAVVINAKRCEAGHQFDKVKPAVLEAPVDMLGSDVVATAVNAGLHAFDVKLRTRKTDVPDIDLDALRRGLGEQAWNRVGAQRGFKGEVFVFGNRLPQQLHTFVPCRAVGVGLSQGRINGHQGACGFVRIVVIGAGCSEGRTAYAAFARAIHACKNVDARLPGRSHVKDEFAARVGEV